MRQLKEWRKGKKNKIFFVEPMNEYTKDEVNRIVTKAHEFLKEL